MLMRPQPIGIFAGAAAHLLLPNCRPNLSSDSEEYVQDQAILSQLLQGELPTQVPEGWRFFVAAAESQIDQAHQLLDDFHSPLTSASLGEPPEEIPWLEQLYYYNSFVLRPDEATWHQLQSRLCDQVLSCLAQVVAFAYGLSSDLPATDKLTDELAAWSLAVVASKQLEHDDFVAARQSLVAAIGKCRQSSPLLSAILLAQSAQVAQQSRLPDELVRKELQQAIEIAQGCQLPGFLAELQMQLGILLQRSAANDCRQWLDSILAYQSALQAGISTQTHPETYAELQNNLGLCYLSMPNTGSSAQLRTGIALQSFRRGLESLTKDSDPELWARISMNLANALQYAPSSHPAENLIQAVEIYEQVLEVRSRPRDPVAYALVIFNQANALAHLGIFKPALEKASEAYKLFQWYDQAEAAASARELVENVNARLAKLKDEHFAPTAEQPAVDGVGPALDQELQHGTV